MQDEMREK